MAMKVRKRPSTKLRESSYNFTTRPIPSRSFFSPSDIEEALGPSGNSSSETSVFRLDDVTAVNIELNRGKFFDIRIDRVS